MAITVKCSQPGCSWEGAPADAATHPCPQTADGEAASAAEFPPAFATKETLEQWLIENGSYSATGEPLNEETREADSRYTTLVNEERDRLANEADDEPEIAEPAAPVKASTGDWISVIGQAVRDHPDRQQSRWAIIGRNHGDVELLTLAAVKSTADQEVELLHGYDGDVEIVKISDLLKQADALAELDAPFGASEPLSPADRDAIDQNADDDHAGAAEQIDVPDPEPSAIQHPDEPDLAPPGTVPADDPSLEPATLALREPDPAEQVFDSQGRAIDPQLAEHVEQALKAEIATTPTAPGSKTLFDASDYEREDLAVPKIDGNAIDRLALGFGGSIMLDRSDPAHVSLYNRVHGQQTLELWVEAKWGGTLASPNTNRDGDLDVIVGRKTLRVESVRIIDADALGALEGLEMVRAAVRRAARAGVPDDQIEAAAVQTLAENQ